MARARTRIAIFPLAVARSLHGSGTEGLLGGLSRVVPRVLARWLDGVGIGDVRFLPFVGRDGGNSGFVSFEDLLDVSELGQVGGPLFAPELAVDGILGAEVVRLRVSHASGGFVVRDAEIPWLVDQPGQLLGAVAVVLAETLDLPEEYPSSWQHLRGTSSRHWIAAEDQILALEANLSKADPVAGVLHAEAALSGQPSLDASWPALVQLARAAQERGGEARERTLAVLERLSSRVPPEEELLRGFVDLLQRGERSRVAIPLQRALLRLTPTDARLALSLADALIRHGSGAEGLAALQPSIHCSPGDPLVLAQAALFAARHSGSAETETLLARLESFDRLPSAAAKVLGVLLAEQGRLSRAHQVLERAVSEHPDDAALRLELGRVLLFQGVEKAATDCLAPLLGMESAHPEVAREARKLVQFARSPGLAEDLDQAERALRAGDSRGALRIVKRAVRRAAEVPDAWLLLGKVRARLGHRRRAARAFGKALAGNAGLAEARSHLGICLVGLGRFAEAYQHLQVAIASLPGQVGPLAHMAQACYYLRRFEEGERWLEQAEARSPGHPTLVETRRMFFSLPGGTA